jgi:hypothetical protein
MQCVSRAGPQPDLRDLEAVAHVHQPRIVGNLQSVEFDLAVAAMLLGPHDRDAAHDAPAGLVAIEQERGQPLARIVARLGDQDEVLRDRGAGDEPFAAVDHPAIAFALCGRERHRRVGAAARMRLGHDER